MKKIIYSILFFLILILYFFKNNIFSEFKEYSLKEIGIDHILSKYFCFKLETKSVSLDEAIPVLKTETENDYLIIYPLSSEVYSPISGFVKRVSNHYFVLDTLDGIYTFYLDSPKVYLYSYINVGDSLGNTNLFYKIKSDSSYLNLNFSYEYEEA